MIGEAAGIGVVLGDPPAGIILQQPVQDVGRFMHGRRDDLGGERSRAAA